MGYRVIITGATGMVGRGVLLECLESDKIDHILLVNRRSLGINHHKLSEILIDDFFRIDEIEKDLKGFDACFFCLGITSLGQSEKAYTRITYDLTIHFAKTFIRQNSDSVFCYVSGAGTDSTEKGRSMWARVKGKTENDLIKMDFKKAYMFRPGYIQPLKGIKSKTKWYAALYAIFRPLYAILKHFPGTATNTSHMGQAMINVTDASFDKNILENKDINSQALKNLD